MKLFLNNYRKLLIAFLCCIPLVLWVSSPLLAQENINEIKILAEAINNLWVLIAAILVLMMQLGFAMLESGFNAAKNTVNILFKNVFDVSVGILIFFCFGYAVMFSIPTNVDGYLALYGLREINPSYLFLQNTISRAGVEHLNQYIDFFFQAAFAATAATICSGAVAGRMKPLVYLILTVVMIGIVYPISGYWVWDGWLEKKEFHDFAGSVLVHSVGGAASLASVILLGARHGRFKNRDSLSTGELRQLTSHNLPLATLGMFILWIGWYGFSAGSALGIVGDGLNLEDLPETSPDLIGKIVLNTTLSACAGAVCVSVIRQIFNNKIELSIVINGVLGGLVAITASCDQVTPVWSIVIGASAGLLVIGGVHFLVALQIDDAVGAFPVHGLCGIWGGIAAGLFTKLDLLTQIIGSIVIPLWSFMVVFTLLWIISRFIDIRVSQDVEKAGLDFHEHGEIAYNL